MASVIVSWHGSCPQRPVREALISKLQPIAELSHSYFDDPPAISFFDQRIEGAVVVAESIAAGCTAAVPLPDEDDAGPVSDGITIRGPLYSIPAVDLHGIAFRLYDGRGLYPVEDILSFVFATLPGDSVPFSRMVEVLPTDQRHRADRTAVRTATTCLLRPSIHLRYYCEQWTNALLGSVKNFFVSDLQWRAYEDCPGYTDLKELFESRADDTALVDLAFGALREGLRAEVESWGEEAGAIKSFWDGLNDLEPQSDT